MPTLWISLASREQQPGIYSWAFHTLPNLYAAPAPQCFPYFRPISIPHPKGTKILGLGLGRAAPFCRGYSFRLCRRKREILGTEPNTPNPRALANFLPGPSNSGKFLGVLGDPYDLPFFLFFQEDEGPGVSKSRSPTGRPTFCLCRFSLGLCKPNLRPTRRSSRLPGASASMASPSALAFRKTKASEIWRGQEKAEGLVGAGFGGGGTLDWV